MDNSRIGTFSIKRGTVCQIKTFSPFLYQQTYIIIQTFLQQKNII